MGNHDTWMQRRGIGSSEREWNAPWERLRVRLATRYGLDVDPGRRWERPRPTDTQNLAVLLRQASAAVDADVVRMLGALAPGVSPTHLDILRRLADKPSAGVNLAEYLRLSPARVSRLLDQLVTRGLVSREESAHDQRVRTAELTDLGQRLVDDVDPHLADLADQWLDELDEEGEAARSALVQLVAVLADLT